MALTLRRAELADVKEMSTIFPRSFHPVSEYMRVAMPDTPVVQDWWEAVHSYSISAAPDVSSWVVTARTAKDSEEIVALARWRFSASTWNLGEGESLKTWSESLKPTGDLSAGTWSFLPLSPGHDEVLCQSVIDFMASTRETYMSNRAHVLLELVLCVHDFKGLGAGRMLIEQCIREADGKGLEIFVETNGPIGKFYEKFGFVERERVGMPGGVAYEEIILVRPGL